MSLRSFSLYACIIMLSLLPFSLCSCGGKGKHVSKETHDSIVLLRKKGTDLRNDSRFGEALRAHAKGLQLARGTQDTLEIVQALNNVGTDYRRMGILDEAQRYHYQAWVMSQACADTSFTARKNLVRSLNGLANVYLTIGNLQRADSALRLALAGEKALGSKTGQAINYANLGSIYEKKGMIDSAWVYYRRSMELNRQDNNTLGVALCHIYFGDLYKQNRQYDDALREYESSYQLMKNSDDDWHALNAVVAMAKVWMDKGNDRKTTAYLAQAVAIADSIKSKEHLVEINTLYYKLYRQRGDWHTALTYYEHAKKLESELVNMDKLNLMVSISQKIERDQQRQSLSKTHSMLEYERAMRHISFIVFFIVLLSLVVIIGLLLYNRRLRARSHRALRRLSDVREAFFTNITHEFRTPLTVILGISQELCEDKAVSPSAKDMASTIRRQGERMLSLVNQLLDLSKVKSVITEPEWQSGNIVAYIGMMMETYASYAQSKGIVLQFIPRERQVETNFVPDYIHKILDNLLSNSFKYVTPGHGKVDIVTWVVGRTLRITVSDNGCGIPASALPHIFEPFFQIDNRPDKVGTGVGLALVAQTVKRLGGTITVDSKENQGTVFYISLPLHAPTAPAIELKSPDKDIETAGLAEDDGTRSDPDNTEQTAGYSILVVEDNADVAQYIGRQLEDNYKVIYARDGKEGLEKARKEIPDVILSDLMMPGMDGIEMCRQIRSDELTSHIPIIIVSAKVAEQDRLKGFSVGADAYLTKPFSREELRVRISTLIDQRHRLQKKFSNDLALSGDSGTAQKQPAMEAPALSELDRRFLDKVADAVYLMMGSGKDMDVYAIAAKLAMSYSQFNRKLSALTGSTPAQYIQRIKIRKAQRMLTAHPELSFAEVAERCGFSDYSNFVRAFKNITGTTPRSFVRSPEK